MEEAKRKTKGFKMICSKSQGLGRETGFSELLTPVRWPVTGQAQLVWRVLRRWRGQWDIFVPKVEGGQKGVRHREIRQVSHFPSPGSRGESWAPLSD